MESREEMSGPVNELEKDVTLNSEPVIEAGETEVRNEEVTTPAPEQLEAPVVEEAVEEPVAEAPAAEEEAPVNEPEPVAEPETVSHGPQVPDRSGLPRPRPFGRYANSRKRNRFVLPKSR